MKLSKVIAAVATIAIVSEVTRRIVTEIDNRRMGAELAELFGWETEEFDMMKKPNAIESAVDKRKKAEEALLAEREYLLASLYDAMSTQNEAEKAKDKARLAEISTELEAL